MAISLPDEARKQSIESIRRYAREKLESEMGDLQAMLLLEFFLEEVAPTVYNQAILDAQAFLQERTGELETTCYELEFGYWKRR